MRCYSQCVVPGLALLVLAAPTASFLLPLVTGLLLREAFQLLRKALQLLRSDSSVPDVDCTVDRSDLHTVKYGLSPVIFGAHDADALPLWVADMDLPCCEQVVRALERRASRPSYGYTFQPEELWRRVAGWLEQEHCWSVSRDSFVFSPSVVTSFSLLLNVFTSEGDAVMAMTPLYRPLQDAVSKGGRHLVCVPIRAGELDWQQLEAQLGSVRVLLLCNPHNPGGKLWSAVELARLSAACARERVLLVSDEIWADWALFGHRHIPAALEKTRGCRLVTLGAPTKSWSLAGLHCSYLVFSEPSDRQRYLEGVSHAFLTYGSTFATEAMLAAYAHGGPWLCAAKRLVERNLRALERALADVAEICFSPPQATYLAWLDCSGLGFESAAELNRFMREEARLLLSPGDEFGEHTHHFQRLNCAVPSATMEEAVRRLTDAVQARRTRRAQRIVFDDDESVDKLRNLDA